MEDVPYGRIIREGWLLIVALALAGSVVAWGVTHFLPRTYSASSTLMLQVDSTQANLSERNQFSLDRIKSYPVLVGGPEVLNGVRTDLHLDPHEYSDSDLRQMLSAENPEDTVLLTVRAEAPTAALSASIANSSAQHLSALIEETENRQDDDRYQVTLEQVLPAAAPSSPASPQVTAITGLGFIAGLALGAILAVYRTTTSQRLRTVSDVRRASGLPVAGQVRGHRGTGRIAGDGSLVSYQEAISNLATLGGATRNAYVLVPASASAVDDETFAGLVEAHSSIGSRACVVDARKEPTRVEGTVALEEALASPRKHAMLSAGSECAVYALKEPAQTKSLAELLPAAVGRLRSEYDIVIIVCDAENAAFLERVADIGAGVVVSVRYNSTSAPELLATVTRLRVKGLRAIGVLMVHTTRGRVEALAETWHSSDHTPYPASAFPSAALSTEEAFAAAEPGRGDRAEGR